MATKPMTKAQLVAALADETGMDKKAAGSALDAVTGIITKEVSGGGAVTLPGVGKIYCRERPERMVRNPATGEQIKKEADKVVKMTIATDLKYSGNAYAFISFCDMVVQRRVAIGTTLASRRVGLSQT